MLCRQVTAEIAQFMVSPVADGEFLLKDPFELAAEGSFNPANVMIGTLSEEGNMALMPALYGQEGPGLAVIDETMYRAFMEPMAQVTDPVIQDVVAAVFGSDQMVSPRGGVGGGGEDSNIDTYM